MTFDAAINYTEDGLTIAALMGAVWSAVAFVKSLSLQKEQARSSEVSDWLQVEIHRIVSTSEQMLSAQVIADQLRSASFRSEVDIQKSDLSDNNVYLALLKLVERGIVGQRWPELFGLEQLPYDPTIGITADAARASYAARNVFAAVSENPGEYTDDLLWSKFGEMSGLVKSDFLLAVGDLIQKQAAYKDDNGKWRPSNFQVVEK